jgi:endonuclease/exonuclease/phosphatase family metal-dependent hydrolase
VLLRTWNVFHGNALPPEREAFLSEMIGLASADHPAILLLQELPVWSLDRLSRWSEMAAVGEVAARPVLGSSRRALALGKAITDLHHGLFRSAFTGEANAIFVGGEFRIEEHRTLVLNPLTFRVHQARRLGLRLRDIAGWGKNRRVCQVVRLAKDRGTLVVANLHATTKPDKRLADAELLRAATFVDGFARPGEAVVLGGDFNLSLRNSRMLQELTTSEWGFEGVTPTGIDHLLVRGLQAGPPQRWPLERRTVGGRLLSDHAPVDRVLA